MIKLDYVISLTYYKVKLKKINYIDKMGEEQ